MKRVKELLNKAKVYKKYLGCVAVTTAMMLPTTVYAAGTDAVTRPLTNLKTLVLAIIAAVGVIILAKNVMEFAQAYQQADSSSMNSAIKGIVAGLIMAGIGSVMSFLGIG